MDTAQTQAKAASRFACRRTPYSCARHFLTEPQPEPIQGLTFRPRRASLSKVMEERPWRPNGLNEQIEARRSLTPAKQLDMKKFGIGLLTCCALLQAGAQESQWLTDLSKAQAQAKRDNKLVLMDFNGSDWCPPCKALRKNVLSSDEFVTYARTNLILVDVDFPRHAIQT